MIQFGRLPKQGLPRESKNHVVRVDLCWFRLPLSSFTAMDSLSVASGTDQSISVAGHAPPPEARLPVERNGFVVGVVVVVVQLPRVSVGVGGPPRTWQAASSATASARHGHRGSIRFHAMAVETILQSTAKLVAGFRRRRCWRYRHRFRDGRDFKAQPSAVFLVGAAGPTNPFHGCRRGACGHYFILVHRTAIAVA